MNLNSITKFRLIQNTSYFKCNSVKIRGMSRKYQNIFDECGLLIEKYIVFLFSIVHIFVK